MSISNRDRYFIVEASLKDPRKTLKELALNESAFLRMVDSCIPKPWEFGRMEDGSYVARRFSEPDVIDDADPVLKSNSIADLFRQIEKES